MSSEQQSMMLELQQLGLTMDDLREYLDTHLYDDFAIDRFNTTAQMYRSKTEEYSKKFGPLNQHCQNNTTENWQWAMYDFPWDY